MNTQYYLKLQAAQGIGAATQRAVLSYLSHHKMPFEEFFNAPHSVWKQAGLSQKQIEALTTQTPLLKQWESRLEQKGFQILGYLDEYYPERLKQILKNQVPPVLYIWGNLNLLRQPSVGFCGSRNTSEKGVAVAEDTVTQITKREWSVVSGHARGIDYTAHTTALKNNGSTIIVLPEGFLNFRLRDELKELVNEKNTLIISEFQPNAAWSVANAMTRNRTICSLSDALIVIQAGTTGGTFEAGKFALQVKVPLFVADYADPNLNGPGNPYFIQKGAKAIKKNSQTNMAILDDLVYEVSSHYSNLAKPQVVQQSLFATGEPF
jgi:DNA protecting protein DprA